MYNFADDFLKLYPMKAKGVKPEKIPWGDPNYIWEEKYDGDRRLLWITADENRNTSRNKSKKTDLPTDKTDNVPHLRDMHLPNLDGTVLDGEFVHHKGFEYVRKIMGALPEKAIKTQEEFGNILYVLYDVIFYQHDYVGDWPLNKRKDLLHEIFHNQIDSSHVTLARTIEGTEDELKSELAEIIRDGGEGMIAKHKKSTLRISDEKCMTPLKNAWIKVKKGFNGDFVVMGYDEANLEYTGPHLDTHTYWMDSEGIFHNISKNEAKEMVPVTKYYYNNWIGAIQFGEYVDGELVFRGSVSSGLTEDLRAKVSKSPDKYLGTVIEVDGMERIKKSDAIRQPVFIRFRDDKEPEDCLYENQKG